MMYSSVSACRVCGNPELISVMSLGELALTGTFPRSSTEKVTCGPVDLVKCDENSGCGLVQLRQSYSIDEMYGMNYGYRSGLNKSMIEHLERKVERILGLGVLEEGDLVIDVGSNDSTTLRAYPKDRYELVGIDPTGVKFSSHYPPEIRLIPEFFSSEVVFKALGHRKAKVITAFSMFYDLEDPVAFARKIEEVLHDEGVWILEQSYLPAMLRTNSFDTICHEHLEFYALRQIEWICDQANLKVLDVELNDVNGGSFSVTVAKRAAKHVPNARELACIRADEVALNLASTVAFEQFRERVEQCGRDLIGFLRGAKREGKTVLGLGASTKGNVLLQYFDIDAGLLAAVGEVNPDKFGTFTPGSRIPIVSEDEALRKDPDYLLVLPWHFRSFFLNNPKLIGRRLVFPLPEFEIVHV